MSAWNEIESIFSPQENWKKIMEIERKLYEASLTGNVEVLNALLQEDQLILDRISLTSFHETPLHVAALHDHLDFARLLLNQKPKLSAALDSQRRSPLHLASSRGHVGVVKELLNIKGGSNMCNLGDEDGRTPLYLAAMNQHLEVIKVICQARPEIGQVEVDYGDGDQTILHMCVRHNCFDALKVLIELWSDMDFGKLVDCDGNTLLHLSAMHKQTQTIKYLLSQSSIVANGNALNAHAFTALDVSDHNTRDLKALETREILTEAGIQRATNLNPLPKPLPLPLLPSPYPSTEIKSTQEISTPQHKRNKNKSSDWLENERGNLVIAATIFAAVTYHAGIYPPGNNFIDPNSGRSSGIGWNNLSQILALVASLTTILILLGGFNLKNKFVLWLLLLAMNIVFVFVTLTYIFGIAQMSPDTWINEGTFFLGLVWVTICGLYWFISTIYFSVRAIRKRTAKRRMERSRLKNENPVHA